MKKIVLTAFILGMLAIGPYATSGYAFTAFPNSWTPFTSTDIDNNGTPYFDNTSTDASRANVGYFILGTGVGGAYNGENPGNSPALNGQSPEYLTFSTNFYFKDGSAAALKILNVAGDRLVNSFGWYPVDSLGNLIDNLGNSAGSPVLNEIFANGSALNVNTPVTFSTYFGLYLKNTNSDSNVAGTYFSQSQFNTRDANAQHFALFRNATNPETWFIGMEDRGVGVAIGDRDYNDMVVELTAVPLPGAVLLLGAGMVRLVAYARRRQDS
jgi:hypothetical protein